MKSKILRLKDKAWKTFSIWIRNRDKVCFTCGSTKDSQAGHFWHNVLDFDEENIHQQCAHCNKYLSGNLAVYSVKLLKLIGKKRFDALNIRHTMALKGVKVNEQYYENIIEKYKISLQK